MKLNPNECHLWFIEDRAISAPSLLQHYETLLNHEERDQHKRFHFEKDRHQYLITRSHLRSILSLYNTHIKPEDWQFQKNAHGKPCISNELSSPIFFNLSHTAGLIVVVIATQDRIGVDVEYLKRDNNIRDLASSVFSPSESHYFQNLPTEQQPRNFFLLWTLKEAYVKAQGIGISLPMVDLIYHNNLNAIELSNQQRNWQFWSIEPSSDYQVSLAANTSENQHFTEFLMHKIYTFDEIEQINYPLKSIPLLGN